MSKEQEILSAELGKIDHRRAQVECLLTYLPYDPHREEGYERETLEAELRWLWARRNEISEQLQHYPALAY